MSILNYKYPLFSVLVLVSLLFIVSCAADPNPKTNYTPSGAIQEKLQEAAQAFGRAIPIPTYLSEGYAITDAQFIHPQYSYDNVELTITAPSQPDIEMSIIWGHVVFYLKPGSSDYKYYEFNDGNGTYGSIVNNDLGDHNSLVWTWVPETVSPNESPPLAFYEIFLSASKEVHVGELVNIARFVKIP